MKVTTLKRISLDGFAKLMENDITDKDFQNFKAFAVKGNENHELDHEVRHEGGVAS